MQLSEDGQYMWNGDDWIPVDNIKQTFEKSNQHIESSDWQDAEKLELRVVNSNEYSWLSKGEIIKSEIHGILEYTSPNPILRMINSLVLLFMAICGFKQKAKLIVTNKRTIVDVRNYSLWVLEKGIDTITINKANLITTGYNSSLFIFKKRYISIDNILIGADRKYSQIDVEAASSQIQLVV